MTSLCSMSSASTTSPADRMKPTLQSLVSAGSVKSTDQGALTSALDDIGAAMTSSGLPAAGTDPSSMKTKVDALVDTEVSDGKLTTDQATELKKVFAQAAQHMHHGHHAGGAPPPSADDSTMTTATSIGTTTSTDSGKQAIDTLIAFLKQLEQAKSSSTNYTATGTTDATASSALLVDGTA